ncbi:MAG: MerR family transcriptional regulator [Oscillospiraceae bacterium]|nr:MerR family transcriptional regulator [Oscillospiraceae bacterium]
MKINQVEQLAGITKGNIRFYEKEGLLTPGRNSENGYREYDDADVVWLKKIRLLRMLDVPIEEIVRLKQRQTSLGETMDRHVKYLEGRRSDLNAMLDVSEALKENRCDLDGLDVDRVLEHMEQKEQEGTRFMNIKRRDNINRYAPAVTGAVAVLILVGALAALLIWAFSQETPPLGIVIGFAVAIGVVVFGVLLALYQRLKQIRGGEEDAASKY